MQQELLASRVGRALNPFFVFTTLFGLAAVVTTGSIRRGLLLLSLEVLAATFVVVYLALRARANKVTDFWLPLREERIVPATILLAVAVGLQASLAVAGAPRQLAVLVGSMLITALFMALLTLWWKASVHAAVAGHAAVWGATIFGPLSIPFALAVPVVMWARVAEQRHTTGQVIAGASVGVLVAAVSLSATA